MKKLKWLLPLSLAPSFCAIPVVSCNTSKYTITCKVNFGSYEGDTKIKADGTATVTIKPDKYHNLPNDEKNIVIKGAEYTYAKETGVITLSNPSGPITITVTCELKSDCFPIVEKCTNCKISGDQFIQAGKEQTLTIVPSTGFVCPKHADIKIENAQIESYDRNTGILKLLKPVQQINNTDSVTLTVNCKKGWKVSFNLTHCKIDGSNVIEDKDNEKYTIHPDTNYVCPDEINVDHGSIKEYDKTSGELTISSNGDGNVSIKVDCPYVPKTFQITTSVVNGSSTGATSIVEFEEATITIKANECYSLPQAQEDIIVKNAQIKSYDPATGQLTIDNATDNVTISVTCPPIPGVFPLALSVSHGKTDHIETKIYVDKPITFKLIPDTYYGLPDNVIAEGATVNFDKANKSVTISEPTKPITLKATFVKIINDITVEGNNVLLYKTSQQYDINVDFVAGKECTYTVSCDTTDTGCNWNSQTKTLTTGNQNALLTMVLNFDDYGTQTWEFNVDVVSSIFNFDYDTETSIATLTGFSNEVTLSNLVFSIPATVVKDSKSYNVNIKENAFKENKRLKKITFSDNLTEISNSAFEKSSLETAIFGENCMISSFGDACFDDANLKGTLHLHSKAESLTIGDIAFGENHITKLILPANLIEIKRYGFGRCFELESIEFEGTSDQWKKVSRGQDWHISDSLVSQVHCLQDDTWIGLDER